MFGRHSASEFELLIQKNRCSLKETFFSQVMGSEGITFRESFEELSKPKTKRKVPKDLQCLSPRTSRTPVARRSLRMIQKPAAKILRVKGCKGFKVFKDFRGFREIKGCKGFEEANYIKRPSKKLMVRFSWHKKHVDEQNEEEEREESKEEEEQEEEVYEDSDNESDEDSEEKVDYNSDMDSDIEFESDYSDDDEQFEMNNGCREVEFYSSEDETSEDESIGDENQSPNTSSRLRQSDRRRRLQEKTVVFLTPDEITTQDIENIATKSSNKTYSTDLGTSCHQCRQKTLDTKTICRSGRCVGVRGQFCGPCLYGRYGESAADALMDPEWECPPCRRLCNCSICRTRNGRLPTGILAPFVKNEGYSSVLDYLRQSEPMPESKRKRKQMHWSRPVTYV